MVKSLIFSLSLATLVACKARQESNLASTAGGAPQSIDALLADIETDLAAIEPVLATMPVPGSDGAYALTGPSLLQAEVLELVNQLNALSAGDSLGDDRSRVAELSQSLETLSQLVVNEIDSETYQRVKQTLARIKGLLAMPSTPAPVVTPPPPVVTAPRAPELSCRSSGASSSYGYIMTNTEGTRLSRVNGLNEAMSQAECQRARTELRDGLVCGSVIGIWAFVSRISDGAVIWDMDRYTIAVNSNGDACYRALRDMKNGKICVDRYGTWDKIPLRVSDGAVAGTAVATYEACQAQL